jgi:signal transduction histidine kinase
MAKYASRYWISLENTIPWCVLVVLATFTYAVFQQVPYAGFDWNYPDGRVFEIYVSTPPNSSLQLGDRLIKIGPTSLAGFQSDLRQTLFAGVQPGQAVPLLIQRGDSQPTTVYWTFPGFNLNEALARLGSEWWLTYVFWVAGTATLFLLRPKDTRWRLLIAFNFLTALWLAAGSNAAHWHIWESAIVLRSAVWLCVPIYLHLHWVYPQPLGHLPRFVLWGGYLVAAVPAVAEWFQVLPTSAYNLGFLVAVAGSAALLVAHFIFKPAQRPDIRLLATISILAFVPSAAVGLGTIYSKLPSFVAGGALLSLPALPLGYLYAAYRRQLGELELRANRLISSYLFFVLLSVVFIALIALAESWLGFAQAVNFISLVLPLIMLLAIAAFGPFQRFIERRVLGAPWPLTQLLEAYIARITRSLDTSTLVHLLNDEVLPSLLVRQSALLRCDESRLTVIYLHEVESSQLPGDRDLPALLNQAGKYHVPGITTPFCCPWVRLILPLSVESKTVGVWLLGRRDPDDFYAQAEIPSLQALAHHTAIVLANIAYAERLRALYQTSIDQREGERASLGRDLHDHILQQMFVLRESAAGSEDESAFVTAYESLTQSLYQTIRGLRPPMLEYGLYRALAALVDDWEHRPEADRGPAVSLAVPESDVRYAPHLELHLYRIVQQAGENALRHARARNLIISGHLEADRVELTVEDDGLGFEAQKLLDLAGPDALSHFGLIGMQERAALIKAQMKIDSALGRGTRIVLKWEPGN